MGKLIPKLSASVNASRRSPDHCLLIFPTSVLPSVNEIERKTEKLKYDFTTLPCIDWLFDVVFRYFNEKSLNVLLFYTININ